MEKYCFVFNQAPVYVEASYVLFDKALNIKWCFGSVEEGIKEMDHHLLSDVTVYPTVRIGAKNFYKLKGVEEVAYDRNITAYVLIGDFRLLSVWKLPILIKLFNRKARIIFWTHGWYGRETLLKKIVKKLFFAPADYILLYGNYAKQLMISNGYEKSKLHVIHNSLNHTAQVELRESICESNILSNHFNNGLPVLVVIGRLTERKNLYLLIEAVSRLKQKGLFYNILFIGDGPERNQLEDISISLHLSKNVWFYGACYDEKTNAELLYNSDLCIVPGDIGLTAIHALTFGVPVISHNCFKYQGPEFEAIKPGVTGDFFEHNNVESLVETITKWFTIPSYNRDAIRKACYYEIDNYWTPEYELDVLKKVLS